MSPTRRRCRKIQLDYRPVRVGLCVVIAACTHTSLGNGSQTLIDCELGFEWSTVDIMDADQLEELYQLLNQNYVEDDDNMFRFDYSKDFLRWALTPPGWKPVWHLGIRSAANHKMLAFISGIPAELRCVDQYVETCLSGLAFL